MYNCGHGIILIILFVSVLSSDAYNQEDDMLQFMVTYWKKIHRVENSW